METILITGATGNVGKEIIKHLTQKAGNFRLLAGVRDGDAADSFLQEHQVNSIPFDFENSQSISKAFEESDIIFLLRPPQISDVKKYFDPLISLAKEKSIKHIVFLSVQGVESSSIIPHHKIEKGIVESGINYTFLRPAYFMQNFTTTLKNDIVTNSRIFLPAGDARFTLIDVADVGAVGAEVLTNISDHINQAYDLTNEEQLTFGDMSIILSKILERNIRFQSPNLISFFLAKRREKVPAMFILVMIMLHYLPRFNPTPPISNLVEKITRKKPRSFRQFVKENHAVLTSS